MGFFCLLCIWGLFWLCKLGVFSGTPLLCVSISRSLAVLVSSTRCAQLSRVGSVPGDELRGSGLGERISCFPDVGLTQLSILPCIPPCIPLSPPVTSFSRQRRDVPAARAPRSAPRAAPAPPPCAVPPSPCPRSEPGKSSSAPISRSLCPLRELALRDLSFFFSAGDKTIIRKGVSICCWGERGSHRDRSPAPAQKGSTYPPAGITRLLDAW